MEPRTVRKATIYSWLLGLLGTALLGICGIYLNQTTELIKDVQAQCIKLDDKKVDKDFLKEVIDRLKRIEDKIDSQ
jgi:hypothetical protein